MPTSRMISNGITSFAGCPIQHLWWHLEERKPPFPLKLDDTAKQFLWKAIVGIPEVEFFVLPEPYAHIFGTQYDDSSDKDKLKSKNPLDQVCFVQCTGTV